MVDCFISYASSDTDIARRFYDRLTGANLSTFLADQSLALGDDWANIIRVSASRATVLILLDSRASRRSAWVQQEAGMAMASGSLVIPVSLDGRLDHLPGWLSGIQAAKVLRGPDMEKSISTVLDRVRAHLEGACDVLPAALPNATAAADFVLRTVLLDQFTAPEGREGAWSRQYDRYLKIYWGREPVRQDVSQGASLTFTGMVVERLAKYSRIAPPEARPFVDTALDRVERFILGSQHPSEGGFGRRSSQLPTRGQPKLALDLRHTCWAVRSLLSIDAERFRPVIGAALEWLAWHAQRRAEHDRWCWTTAPLTALLSDERALAHSVWSRDRNKIAPAAEEDLARDFSARHGAWVNGESGERRWIATDNALYVLYTLSNTHLGSDKLRDQTKFAIQQLAAKLRNADGASAGLPLFTDSPEAGPTAQLLEILSLGRYDIDGSVQPETRDSLSRFVSGTLSASRTMPVTFSWHLSSALGLDLPS